MPEHTPSAPTHPALRRAADELQKFVELIRQEVRQATSKVNEIRYVRVVRREWRVPIAFATIGALLALAYLCLVTRRYEVRAQLLILQEGGRPFNVANADLSRPVETGGDYIPNHLAIVSSPAVVRQAIDMVGLENLPTLRAARDPVHKVIETCLKVSRPERQAKVIQLAYQARSPEEGVRMLDALVASYRKYLEENYPRGAEVVALIERASRELGAEVEKAEKDYLDFRRKNPLLVTDEKGRSFMTTRLEHWDQAINRAEVREAQLKAQIDLAKKLSREGAGLLAIVHAMSQLCGDSANPLLNSLSNTTQANSWDYIRQLSLEQQQLAERYGPQYSKVQGLQEQIARIQERVRASRGRYEQGEINDLIKSCEEGLNTSVAMRAALTRGFEQDKKVDADFLADTTLRNNLERRRALFNVAVDQLKQAQLARDFSPVSAYTLEPPTPNPDPVRPRWLLTLALAALAGLAGGAGLVVMRHQRERWIDSPEELSRALGLPVLGQLPFGPVPDGEIPALISDALPNSPLSEACKMLRTALMLLRRQRPVQVVLVTSPDGNEGKTTTASNLAISLARAGQRVLLVDADLRHPVLDRLYRLPPGRGLTDVLQAAATVAQAVRPSAVDRLDVLTAGAAVTDPAELLMSPRLKEFFAEARSAYETVVVDTSPLLTVTDPCLVGALADGALLVVRAKATCSQEVQAAAEALRAADVPLLGAILNGTHQPAGGDSPPAADRNGKGRLAPAAASGNGVVKS